MEIISKIVGIYLSIFSLKLNQFVTDKHYQRT